MTGVNLEFIKYLLDKLTQIKKEVECIKNEIEFIEDVLIEVLETSDLIERRKFN